MKKLFTMLVGFVALLATTNAQTNTNARTSDGTPASRSKQPVQFQKKAFNRGSSRASTEVIALDYDGIDEAYSVISGGDYTRYAWDLNKRYSPTDVFTMKYCAVIFDSLVYLDQAQNQLFVPRNQASFNLDSLDLIFAHTNTTGTYDTIKITVFNRASMQVTGVGTAQGAISATTLWDTTIITNVSLAAGGNYGVQSVYPNLAFATGQTFGVRIDFDGDTANKFQISIGSRDDCAGNCLASPSAAGFNTLPFLNWDAQFPNTGLYTNQIFFDCNQTGSYEASACENIFLQDAWIIPYLTLNVNYGAVITADSLRGCPNGTPLTLNANAFGSTATPYTYSWASTSGTLTSSSDQSVDFIVGANNATVTVTVTDGNNQTTVATVTIQSRGVNVNFTAQSPVDLTCGSSLTLVTQLTGYTTGKFYSWSTGATGTSVPSVQVNTAGNYTVTVTNNAGCSTTASISVQYPGGVTNNVTFTSPTPLCEDRAVTFINTSTNQSGWTPLWTFGDGNTNFNLNGTNTYANPGVYAVQLQMTDANNCIFKSPSVNVQVLAASNAACTNIGIEDVTFDNAISMIPNPSTGTVTMVINGVEKNLSVKVYNIIGSMVKAYNTNDVPSTITKSFDYSDLANGTYLVKIQSGDKTAVKRLTISK